MRIEFIEAGAPECPLLLFHDTTPESAAALSRALTESRGELALHALEGVDAGGLTVTARMGRRNLGVRRKGECSFEWVMHEEGWAQVTGLLEPFVDGSDGWQRLSYEGPIAVVFSPSGRW